MKLRIINIVAGIAAMVLTIPVLAGVSQAETVMGVRDCLDYGFAHNPSILAADYAAAASEENRKAIRADLMPSLSSSYGFSRIESENAKGSTDTDYLNQYIRSFSITLSQTLYAGSRIVNSYDKAKLDTEKAMADKALAELELAYNIQATFFQLISAKQDVNAALESVKRLEEGVKSARAHLEKALIPYTEVLSAEVDLADARQRLSISQNNVNRKRVALFSLMNMDLSREVRFEGGLEFFSQAYESDFNACWEKARANRPDIQSLEKDVAMALKDADIALGRYLPMVKLDLGYHDQNRDYDKIDRYDRDQRNRYYTAGVTASWEIFDGGRAWYNKQKSSISADRARQMIKDVKLRIREGIRKALFSIDEARDRIRQAADAVTAAQENYKVEKRRLQAGLTTIPLLLDAQVRLTRAQGNYTQAMLDYQLGRSELMFMMGETSKKVDNKGF